MKTILITGASSGFGLATAELLAKDGHKLILLARRSDRLEQIKLKLKAEVHTATVDVTDKKQVHNFFKNIPADFQDIDVLINNAGLARGMELVQDGKLENWEEMIDTNIKGLLYVTHSTLDIMKRRNQGHIINIGSSAGANAYKGGNVYGGTKAFVRQFSRNLRTDLFGMNIRITNIEPGMAETEFATVRFRDKDKAAEVYKDTRPLVAQDIAETILWVLSRPAHVNIDNVELMPTDQTFGGLIVNRNT